MEKHCSKCGETKPTEAFYKNRSAPDGLNYWCKVCTKASCAASYQTHRQKRLAAMKTYALEHREDIRTYQRAWYYANHEEQLAQHAAWRAAHGDYIRQYRQWYRAHHYAKLQAQWASLAQKKRTRAWKATHREHLRTYHTAYLRGYMVDPARQEAARDANRRYRKHHPEKCCDMSARKRALLKGAPVVTRIDRLAIIARDGGTCHLCGKKPPRHQITLDHLIPLSQGGNHTPENVAVACHSCNSRRGAGRIPAQLRLF